MLLTPEVRGPNVKDALLFLFFLVQLDDVAVLQALPALDDEHSILQRERLLLIAFFKAQDLDDVPTAITHSNRGLEALGLANLLLLALGILWCFSDRR